MIAASATILDCPPERAWQEVQTSRLLAYITSPLVRFVPVDPLSLPPVWSEERYLVQMRLFGLLPFGTQWIVITRPVIDGTPGREHYELRDNGHGDFIATWDHRIILRETEDGRTHYTDRVEVQAGLLTPFIWAYASLFYRYRQHRWRRLVASGFAYPGDATEAT
ncbi:MAG TPA: hypothetical protein PKD53_06830 [Chloroflexaceae bacterium]|mgnify:CR=1 FL=1|nr:hypothetical protein [Chloroflexaceae bacterium]